MPASLWELLVCLMEMEELMANGLEISISTHVLWDLPGCILLKYDTIALVLILHIFGLIGSATYAWNQLRLFIHAITIGKSDQKYVKDMSTWMPNNFNSALTSATRSANRIIPNSFGRWIVVGWIGATLDLKVNKVTWTQPVLSIECSYTHAPKASWDASLKPWISIGEFWLHTAWRGIDEETRDCKFE